MMTQSISETPAPLQPGNRSPLVNLLSIAIVATLLCLALNALWWLAGQFVFMVRAFINVDYFLVLALLYLKPRLAGASAFVFLVLIDTLFSFSPGFYFHPDAAVDALRDAINLDLTHVSVVVALLLAGAALLWTALGRIATSKSPPSFAVLLIICCSLAIAVALVDRGLTGGFHWGKSGAVLPFNLATSPLSKLGKWAYRRADNPPPDAAKTGLKSATAGLFSSLRSGQPLSRHIVLVVVESMGLFKSDPLNEWQMTALRSTALQARYTVSFGTVAFQGSTVPGELRELCQARFPTLVPNSEQLHAANCLPKSLVERGYASFAIHGFPGSMFSRTYWYPLLGFKSAQFAGSLRAGDNSQFKSHCGITFRGLCDTDIAEYLRKVRQRNATGLGFYYWLTLNGHLPSSEVPASSSSLPCVDSIGEGSQLCNLVRHHDLVLKALIAQALDDRLPETTFVVVGDHMPPFWEPRLRNYFDPTRVPFVVLTPAKL